MIDKSIIRAAAEEIAPRAQEIRHHLHQHPELSHYETDTAAFIEQKLNLIGLDSLESNVGGFGLIGTIRGTNAGKFRRIAIRADIDALPIQETNDLPYRSSNPGVMHACGHDGHTSVLLGAASALAKMRSEFSGEIRLLFQPAEETVGGALKMCAAGAMEGVDAVIALHGWPGIAAGQIGVRSGPMMASSDTFDIKITGSGSHAAMPHKGVDPILVGSMIVNALQTVASREFSPTDSVVVSVTCFNAGTAYNIIPGTAELKGTVRCLTEENRQELPLRIERIVSGICDAMRAKFELQYHWGIGVTRNDDAINSIVREIGIEHLGAENVVDLDVPSMGAEDFAAYLDHAPGTMFRLGVGVDSPNLHTPTYNFSDDAISPGIEMFTAVALKLLNEGTGSAR